LSTSADGCVHDTVTCRQKPGHRVRRGQRHWTKMGG
jgi:hypothetical protein